MVHSLSSGKGKMFLCAACHAFTPHVNAWKNLIGIAAQIQARGYSPCSSAVWKQCITMAMAIVIVLPERFSLERVNFHNVFQWQRIHN